MKIFVKVKTHAREEKLVAVDDKHYLVSVKAAPLEGEANEEVFRVLGKYFNVAPTTITIVHGAKGREKIIDVPLTPHSLDPFLE